MATPTIDYAKLADQARQIGTPSDGGAIDYAALADQARSTQIPGLRGEPLPGPPKAPLPAQLNPDATDDDGIPTPTPGMTASQRAISNNPYSKSVGKSVGGGIVQMAAPGVDNKAGGASKIIRGVMQAGAPMLPAAIASAGLPAVAAGVATGYAGGKIARAGLTAMGAPEGVADLGEDIAGIGAGAAGGKYIPGVASSAKTAVGDAFAREPVDSMTRALKPKSSNIGFKDNLARSLPELKATEEEVGKPVSSLADLLSAIKHAKQRVWGQYQQIVGPQAQAKVDMGAVADAMSSTIPERTRAQNPTAAMAIEAKADTYRRPMTIQQAEDNLKHVNAELDAYFGKNPAARTTSVDKNPDTAALNAEGQALRKIIYGWVDQDNGGAAPRELKQRYGSLMNLEEEAYRRQNVADRQQPDSLSEQVGKVRAAGHVVAGVLTKNPVKVAQGMAETMAGKWLKEQQTTDALIRDAFARFKGSPTPVDMPAPFQPKGLLTGPNQPNRYPFTPGDDTSQPQSGGTMYTETPEDAIARVQRQAQDGPTARQGMNAPPFQRKALPAGGKGPFTVGSPGMSPDQMPADLRGGRGVTVPDTSSSRTVRGEAQVPQADPSVIPLKEVRRVIDMNTQPAPRGKGADSEWWAQQPPTRPEIESRYRELFDQADKIAARRALTAPSVPSSGVPEGVSRGVDARQNIAKQVLRGKTWDQATPSERLIIDQLVSEGYGSSPIKKYAKGGIIRRPQILVDAETHKPTGLMAEAGPEAIVPLGGETAANSTVPEKPDAIAEQISQLSNMKRRVVMIPRGTFPHLAPEGMATHADQHGNKFIFNPKLIGIHDIKLAVAMNRLPSILGAAHGGMGVPDKSKLRGNLKNVIAKSKRGISIQSSATDIPHIKSAIRQSKKITPNGGTVTVESPGKEIARRQAV